MPRIDVEAKAECSLFHFVRSYYQWTVEYIVCTANIVLCLKLQFTVWKGNDNVFD